MEFVTSTPQDTRALAVRLALKLTGGELILLSGPLGSGKTTFVQGLAEGIGSKRSAASPTFVLERRYPGRLELVHLDLYRIHDPGEVEALGLRELLDDPESAVAVEWADKFPELFKERDRLEISFEPGDRAHRITLEAAGDKAETVLGALR